MKEEKAKFLMYVSTIAHIVYPVESDAGLVDYSRRYLL